MLDMLQYEREAWNSDSGLFFVAGVDEAGRGPLAGPVVAAAAVFDRKAIEGDAGELFLGLTDSKALTEKKRDYFFEQLQACPFVETSVAVVGPEVIDSINILQATWRAMAEALSGLKGGLDFALVDGNPVRGLPCASNSIVKGDAKSLSIAAASIVAKVTRDRMMVELDALHPEYGFAKHKGYGTRQHIAAIREHGPVACHRKTFRPISDLRQGELF